MLPEHLASHLSSAQAHTDSEGPRPTIAQLIHASQVQMMAARTAAAQFAHTNGLNLIDFNVVQSVVSLGEDDETATPGYIARQLTLSASTLTSILERLVRSGYLIRERDSADRRRISIYHTDKSAQLIADFYLHLSAQVEAEFGTADDEQLSRHISVVSSLTNAAERTVAYFEKSGENLRSATQGRAALSQAQSMQDNAAV